MAEFMRLLHATDFNEHRIQYPSHCFSTLALSIGEKSLIFVGRKEKEPVNLDPRELKEEPCNSGCVQRTYNQKLEGKKKLSKAETYPRMFQKY